MAMRSSTRAGQIGIEQLIGKASQRPRRLSTNAWLGQRDAPNVQDAGPVAKGFHDKKSALFVNVKSHRVGQMGLGSQTSTSNPSGRVNP